MANIKSIILYFYLLCIVLFNSFSSKGQDTIIRRFSRSSISVGIGVNILYPDVSRILEGGWLIAPEPSDMPWVSLSYNYSLSNTVKSVFGLNFGIGYTQYNYNLNDTIIIYLPGSQIQGPPSVTKYNIFELSAGPYLQQCITKIIGWYNELYLSAAFSFQSSAMGFPLTYFSGGAPNGTITINSPYKNSFNLSAYYQTGISFKITNGITILPSISFPLINLTQLISTNDSYKSTNYYYNHSVNYQELINPFKNFRTCIILTYYFNKK